MDFITDLLGEPATPRITTYTSHGRMELSGQTVANWQAKVANLLTGIGAQPGDTVLLAAAPSWQPAVIALGAWKVGCSVISSFDELASLPVPSSSHSDATPSPAGKLIAVFTDDPDLAEEAEPYEAEEVYLLSNDPFGRGVEESGGDVPFGVNDFSPELRVQPDAFMGLQLPDATAADLSVTSRHTAAEYLSQARKCWGDQRPRAAFSPWADAQGLASALEPLAVGGSTVIIAADGVSNVDKTLETEGVTVNRLDSR